MAEVVGLLASVATLIEVAGKTGRTISRIRRLQASPPRYVLAAQNEIDGFTAALDLIQDMLNNGKTVPSDKAKAQLARLHKQATDVLMEFDDFLNEKVISEQPSSSGALKLRRRAKIKEAFGEAQSEFLEFQQQLMSIKQNLQLVLQALQFQFSMGASLHLQSISFVQSGVATTVDAGNRDMTVACLEKAVVSTATKLSASKDSARYSTSRTLNSQRDDCIVFSVQQARQGCQPRCPCQCHMALRGSTPRWLQGLMGTVFFSLSGVPIINRKACNIQGCGSKDTANGMAHFQYVMPNWALPYAIETTATWQTLGGMSSTWTLKIPRLMNDTGLFNKFHWLSQDGTVEDIQELMAVSGMRAFDLFDGSLSPMSTLFALAVNTLRADVCQMLIENGADVSYRDASGVSMIGIFWLYQHNSSSFSSLAGHTLLAEASESLDLTPGYDLVVEDAFEDLANHLRNYPAAITLRDDSGLTLLHWAAACGAKKALQVLIRAGSDVNAVCKRGRTPLMWTHAAPDTSELCDILIRGGADVNKADLEGCTALMLVVNHSPVDNDAVVLLLDAGSDIHHVDQDGLTALALAANRCGTGSVRSCMLLLERGALLYQVDAWGWTPFAYAIRCHDHEVLDLFIENGAQLNADAEGNSSSNIELVASWGDVETMLRLRDACMEDVSMDEETVQRYWELFEDRNETYVGFRAPIEVERAAFQELLDSVVPRDPALIKSKPKLDRLMPGAFPADDTCGDWRAVSDPDNMTEGAVDQGTSGDQYAGVDTNHISPEEDHDSIQDDTVRPPFYNSETIDINIISPVVEITVA